MARLAVLASGNGGNFQALAEALASRPLAAGMRHDCVLLVYDRRDALAAERAARLGVAATYVTYHRREQAEAEAEIAAALERAGADLVALAGFMRLLSPTFVAARRGRIVNVHPSLLPAWPGAHAVQRAYQAGAAEFGVTVHLVDEGMDTGPILARAAFAAEPKSALCDIEARVHEIEHELYPRTVLGLLDAIEEGRRGACGSS